MTTNVQLKLCNTRIELPSHIHIYTQPNSGMGNPLTINGGSQCKLIKVISTYVRVCNLAWITDLHCHSCPVAVQKLQWISCLGQVSFANEV